MTRGSRLFKTLPRLVDHAPLPRLIGIADGFASGRGEWNASTVQLRAFAAVAAGVEWLHLRDHAATLDAFTAAAEDLSASIFRARPDTLLSVNTYVSVAQRLRLAVHLGYRGLSIGDVRCLEPHVLLSAAAHSEGAAIAAVRQGADVVLFSPVFPTASKPGHAGAGLDALAACCAAVPETPVYALGGITPDRVRDCLDAGAYGVAVLSGILFPQPPADIFDAVQAYRVALGLPTMDR